MRKRKDQLPMFQITSMNEKWESKTNEKGQLVFICPLCDIETTEDKCKVCGKKVKK